MQMRASKDSGRFAEICDQILEHIWKSDPVAATFVGVHKYDHLLGDRSLRAIQAEINALRDFSQALKELDPGQLAQEEREDCFLLGNAFSSSLLDLERIEGWKHNPGLYPEEALYGIFLLIIRDFAPLEERLEKVVARLEEIPRFLEEGKKNLENPPPVYNQVACEVCEGGISFLEMVLPEEAGKVPGKKDALLKAGNAAKEAFASYLGHLREVLAKEARGDFAVGKEIYDLKLKLDHLFDIDTDELLRIGEENFAEAESEIDALAKRMEPSGGGWREAVRELKQEHPPWDLLLTTYREEMAKAREFVSSRALVTIPGEESLEIIETPIFERSTIPYAAYVHPAPFEKEQKGFFYVTPINKLLPPTMQEAQLRGHSRYAIPIVALHEAYPGHHLQLVHANRSGSRVRKLFSNSVLAEGWALYCEEMMYEQGYYRDERIRLLQLKDLLWRAARVIIDVKLHTRRMTVEEAVRFLLEKVYLEIPSAEAEVKRYTMSPTQPMSYLLGKQEILRIREEYRRQKGESFDLREFHDWLLSFGSVPPRIIRERLAKKPSPGGDQD